MIRALRRWARRHTEQSRYSPVGIAFHWVMAALILFQLGWGWYMTLLPAGGSRYLALFVHAGVGFLILVLAIARLLWRLFIPGPVNDADRLGWQTRAATATHYVFYICFFGLPLTGWFIWSSFYPPGDLSLAGVLPWPLLPLDQAGEALQAWIMYLSDYLHEVMAIVLAVLIPLHVGAALKHHFWDRHDVLSGMLPQIPDAEDPRPPPHRPREPRPPPGEAAG